MTGSVAADPGSIRAVERHSFAAWPAPEVEIFDGWRLHHGDGFTRRANSVNPVAPSTLAVEGKLAYCERWYAQRGLPVLVRLTPASLPVGLDAVLEARGYSREAATSVMVRELTGYEENRGVHLSTGVSVDWLAARTRLGRVDQRHSAALERILRGSGPAAAFAEVSVDRAIVGVGLVVVGDGLAGLYAISVDPQHRGRGLGRRISEALLAWAHEAGAARVYLQVHEPSSPEAVRLYESMGFSEAYRYWYRLGPAGQAPTRPASPSST